MIVDDDSVVEMARDWKKLAEKVKRKSGEKLQFLDLDLCECFLIRNSVRIMILYVLLIHLVNYG
jgi:hypothetical protein